MTYLIIGGTGTLGKETTRQILSRDHGAKIIIFSRDELKQKEMKNEYKSGDISFVLGDIRDLDSIHRHMRGVDTVFHFAALKHVEIAEENPEECIKTNLLGTVNVADSACSHGVSNVVFTSTDKAVDPINLYGLCKGASELVLLNRNRTQEKTRFSVFRWGNILGSRGSVIHLFAKSIRDKKPITVTNPEMTRFWMRIEDAASFMLDNYTQAPKSFALVPKMKSASIIDIVMAVSLSLGEKPVEIKNVGLRAGEKIHEALWSQHSEFPLYSNHSNRYTETELVGLVDSVLKK